jgi:carbon-monoxide dehydrogenase large subunit
MEKFGKAQPVRRVEDVRFLTGGGRYVDDIAPKDALHAVVVRSTSAHGRILGIDTEEARTAPGVHLVMTAADLEEWGVRLGLGAAAVRNRDGSRGATPLRPVLAKDRVRYVGEAVAVVFAETLQQAQDAADLVMVDLDDLDPKIGRDPGGPLIHDEVPENVAFDWAHGDEAAVDAAFASAARTVSLEIPDNRVIANPMEPRGAFAEWDGERLHFCVNGQGVWGDKTLIAKSLGLEPEQVRVTNPDVGGGFGMKGAPYPEHVFLPAAARHLGRAVRWMETRTEAMLTDNQGRDLVSTCEMAFDADNRITAYRIDTLSNLGAYNSQFGQLIQSDLFAKVAPGVYDIRAFFMRVRGIYTNTVCVDAYRGAGRPEAMYAIERLMDYAARELGLSPWELRRINFVPASAFPYESATGETYDVGDFDRVLTRAEAFADVAGFADRRAADAREGRLRGIGLAYYIEAILGAPEESVEVEFTENGARIYVGTQSNGQGHETVYAQFLSDQTGIPADRIEVVQGDSDLIATGGGTGGSRSVTVQANVTLTAVSRIVEAYSAFLAERLGGTASFDDEVFRVEGSNETPTMLEVAAMARADGRTDLLTFRETTSIEGRSYPNGAHVAEVVVDPETGRVIVDRYTVTDDFGNLINPMLVEGQIHGGVAQGLGQALAELAVYDDDGQLLTATFMDYAMPRADDVPMIAFLNEPVPSIRNPMGMKGCGEAGTVGSLASVTNAVLDALWDEGVRRVDMPLTPHRVWEMLNARPLAAE